MGDAAIISPRVPSTCAQNAIVTLLTIHIVPSRQMYVAIDNPSLVPSVSCRSTNSYVWNHASAADDVSHPEPGKSTAAGTFLTCTHCETGSKLPEFSGIAVSARANQYSTKAPSLFRRFIQNGRCSCHGRRPFCLP